MVGSAGSPAMMRPLANEPFVLPGSATTVVLAHGLGGGTSRTPWRDVESPVAYGFAARNHYSKKYPAWGVELERELRGEWETGNKDRRWDDVRDHVRTGFNAPR